MELRVRRGRDWVWAEAALTNLLDDPTVRGVVCNLRLSLRRTAQEEAETRVAQLETALETRVIIEQAKGFLAGRDRGPSRCRLGATAFAATPVSTGSPCGRWPPSWWTAS